jgi:hypothetical protein
MPGSPLSLVGGTQIRNIRDTLGTQQSGQD